MKLGPKLKVFIFLISFLLAGFRLGMIHPLFCWGPPSPTESASMTSSKRSADAMVRLPAVPGGGVGGTMRPLGLCTCGVLSDGDGVDAGAGAAKRWRTAVCAETVVDVAQRIAKLEAAIACRDHRVDAELEEDNVSGGARKAAQHQRIGELTAEVAVLSLRLNRRRRSSSWSECSLPTSMTCGTACSIWSGLPARGPRLVC